MAIAYDNSAVSDASDGSGCCGNYSFSYTCSGSNRLLVVIATGDNSQQTTAITYAGVSMTSLTEYTANNTGGANSQVVEVWYLVNPASGSNTLSVSRNGYGRLAVASYTGVDQVNPIDSWATTSSSGNPQSVSTTVVKDNCWLVGFGVAPASGSYTARISSGGTTRVATATLKPSSIWQSVCIGDSNGTVASGSRSMSFDNSSGGNYYSNGGTLMSISPYIPTIPNKVVMRSFATQRASRY